MGRSQKKKIEIGISFFGAHMMTLVRMCGFEGSGPVKLRHAVVCGFLGWAAVQKSAYHPHFLHTCRFSSVDCCSFCETDYRITCGFLPQSAVFRVFLRFSENTHFIADTVTNTQFYSTGPFFCVVLRISVFSTFCPQGPSSLSFRPSPFELRDSKHMGYRSGSKHTYELLNWHLLPSTPPSFPY